jgi:hypothetical protein
MRLNLGVSNSDAHLVAGIYAQLIEDSIAIDDIRKAVMEAKAEQERQRRLQEQKASGVKSPL